MTVFYERSDRGAKETLETFQHFLLTHRGCQSAQLLESVQQRGLYLLVTTWEGGEPPAPPEGTKVWAFRPT